MNTTLSTSHPDRRWSPWRIAGWSLAAILWILPMVAMQFTDEVNWTVGDFIFAAILLLGVGIPLELAALKTRDRFYRTGVGFAVMAVFLLVWVTGAVGIIGSEENPANLMYFGVVAIAIFGSVGARFRPDGMAFTMAVAALAQVLVAVIAIVGRMAPEGRPIEIVGVTGIILTLWVASALLLREAARRESERDEV